jgi:hypothetical protein
MFFPYITLLQNDIQFSMKWSLSRAYSLTIMTYVAIQATYRVRKSSSFFEEMKFIFECHLWKEQISKSKYKYKK